LIDGQTYIGRNDNSYTFGIDEKNAASEDIHYEDTTVRFGMTVLAGNRPFIATENERKEFKGKYPDDQMVLYGKEIAGGNEVMISDYMLEKFGVPTNEFVSLVGKKISVVYDDGVKASVLIEDSSICGILSQNFFRVERNRYSAQFFIHLDNSSLRQLADFDLTIETDVPEFKAMEDAVKKLEASNSGSISYDERVVKIYGDLELEKEIMSFVLSLVVLAISIAFVMNICYIQYDQIQKKKYFFGLLGAIGMPRRSIRKLLFSELCFIAVLAAILSSIISVVLLRAIAHYTEGVLGSALYNQPSQFMAPSLMVFIAAPAISGIIACYNEMRLNKERLIALLNKSTVD
jgi:ABC-type lipoprotein release transport system permease subunit